MTQPRLPTLAIAVVLMGTLTRATSAAQTQSIAQLTLPTSAPASNANAVVQHGAYLSAPIILDGGTLFSISTAVNAPAAQEPISERVAQIQSSLAQLLTKDGSSAGSAPIFDPKTIRIHDRRAGDAIVLEAVDAKHTDPLPIVTVTSVDARANALGIDALASQWQATLETALAAALSRREPAVERRSVQSVILLGLALLSASLIVAAILRDIWRRMASLQAEVGERGAAADEQAAIAPEDPAGSRKRRRFLALQLRSLRPAQRLTVLGATAEALLWGLAWAWFLGITWSLSLFAETTPLAQSIIHGALGVVATVVLAALISRVLDALIGRASGAWRVGRLANSEDRARMLLRVPTIAGAVSGAKNFVLVFVAALSILGQLGVPISSVVTIGGLTAIALSLAAQNFVRDFLNGFLVLLEDQYVVGDYVTINNFSGLVERLTLRMVQIRDAAGDLVTIPHSSVINVVNQSRNWSRVDYRVPIDPAADVDRALEIVRAEITTLITESEWAHDIEQPIEWIGIDALSKDWIILRASIRTAPLRQFELRRRINERVLAALRTTGIALGAQLPTTP